MTERFLPLVLASLLTLALAACGNGDEANTLPPLTDVATFEVAPASMSGGQGWDGLIEAVRRADLSAQTAGRVTSVEVDVNARVAAGTVLMRISAIEQEAGANTTSASPRWPRGSSRRVRRSTRLVRPAIQPSRRAMPRVRSSHRLRSRRRIPLCVRRLPAWSHVAMWSRANPSRPVSRS